MKQILQKLGNEWKDVLLWIVSAICAAFLLVGGLFYYYTGDPFGVVKYFRTFAVIESHYAGAIEKQELFNGSLEGIVGKLGDKHSIYLDGENFQSFSDQTTGSYAGIGVYLGKGEDGALVAGVMDDSPASEAGLVRGDVIVAIDGTATKGRELEDISKSVRGPAGSSVTLTISHDGTEKDVVLERRQIHMKTVAGQMLEGTDIGYIRVAIFSENTGEEFTKQFDELQSQGMKQLILDLRDNPGGLVDQAVIVASNFVPTGSTIVSYTNRDGKEEAFSAKGTDNPIPMVVLINENSASASEIVAGDVQDLGLGPIVGVKSYGKGTVQGVYAVDAGSAIKLTVAKYRTTKGREIDGQGIIPDVEVPLKASDLTDYQLEKAIAILKGE
ncbi:MAG: S41 family peptidase [Megasphaera sp.]|jgi:carboxyl-terminal processing protease|nr:S41 family peptidase [Megasphaera sp.]MCH4188247.1 S41 family peptidase [Megasphaera sp.]MCH4217307.1 S41 family peptidase [Megasphaera sp.]